MEFRGGTLILQIAMITRSKKQDVFIDVIGAMVQKGVCTIGLIVGDTVSEDDIEYKHILEEKILADNLNENVFFVGRRSDVPDLLSIADYVFVPSQEGLSLAAVEAMCAGVDVVADKIGGAYELLERAKCGILYETNSTSDEIADVILSSGKNEKRLQNGYDFCLTQTEKSYKTKILSVFDI